MNRLFRSVLAVFVFLAAILATVMPWNVPVDTPFLFPFAPASVILAVNMRSPDAIPAWIAFVGGIAVDALLDAPLGFWAIIYLSAFAAAAVLPDVLRTRYLTRWAAAFAILLGLGGEAWVLASFYLWQMAGSGPIVQALPAAVLVYPVMAFLTLPFASRKATRDGYFVRGVG